MAKTGTTSIQARLAYLRPEIESLGYYVPRAGTINRDSGHHCLAWSLTRHAKAREFCQAFHVDMFRHEIEAKASDRAVVVSSEELSALSFNYLGIRALLRLFPRHDVHVIAYVREQAEFFNSFYQEVISDFVDPGSMDDFIEKRLAEKRYEYDYWFNAWYDLLGAKLLIRPFDRTILKDGDVVADFLQTIDLRLPPDGGSRGRNVAWNNLQVAAALELVRRVEVECRGPPVADFRQRLKRMATRCITQPELSAGERYWGISEALVLAIRQRYAANNSAFFDRHGMPNFAFSAVSAVPAVTEISFGHLDALAKACIDRTWTEMRHELSSAKLV